MKPLYIYLDEYGKPQATENSKEVHWEFRRTIRCWKEQIKKILGTKEKPMFNETLLNEDYGFLIKDLVSKSQKKIKDIIEAIDSEFYKGGDWIDNEL